MISIGNIFNTNPTAFDEVWVICFAVHELGEMFTAYDNVRHVPELAPTQALFRDYRGWVHSEQWDRHMFDEYYVPRFISDIQVSDTSMKLLHELVQVSDNKNIRLVCFCADDKEEMCHRSIVAGILLNMGACIDCKDTYRIYRLDG